MSTTTRAAIPTRKSSHVEGKVRPRMALGRVSNVGHFGGVPTARKSHVIRQTPSVRVGPASVPVTRAAAPATTASETTIVRSEPMPEFHFSTVPIGDFSDPMDVADYEHIIYRTMRQKELASPPIEFNQTLITLRDRNLLIDALCRFHYKLGLMTNTFYRFIGIFDRFLTKENVAPNKLKLYGCAAFLIASKIEDIYPAQSTDLIKLSDRAFTRREIFNAEIEVINAVGFDTTFATPLFYLTQFMRIEDETKEDLLLARYVLEAMQSFDRCFGMPASKMASLAVLITRWLKGAPLWPASFAGYTKYTFEELEAPAKCIREMLAEEDRDETRFMRRKYGCETFLGVARIRIPAQFP